MENILVIDLETTGLNPKVDKTIEIGAMLFSVKHKVVLQTLAFFLPCEVNPVEHINHIKVSWTQGRCDNEGAFDMLNDMAPMSDAIIAHNAQFDKGFLMQLPELAGGFWSTPWICTKQDFIWPCELPRKRLMDVCAGMGLVYPINAHRSLVDCQALVDCFVKVEDLEQRLEAAKDKVLKNVI